MAVNWHEVANTLWILAPVAAWFAGCYLILKR